jgi:hypothetical protein
VSLDLRKCRKWLFLPLLANVRVELTQPQVPQQSIRCSLTQISLILAGMGAVSCMVHGAVLHVNTCIAQGVGGAWNTPPNRHQQATATQQKH